MKRTAAVVVFLLFASLAAYGVAQCPNGSCSRPTAPQPHGPTPQIENHYRWLKRADRPAESYLYLGSKQIGGYNHDEGIYLPLVCGCGLECDCNPCRCKSVWGDPGEPPIAPPVAAQSGHLPTGVDWHKIPVGDTYEMNGKSVSRAALCKVLGDATLTDDSAKPHLTYIAANAVDRQQFAVLCKDPALADIVQGHRVQVYDPANSVDAAILEPFGLASDKQFQTSGKMLVVQPPADKHGKSKATVYYTSLDQAAEDLRKKDPDWDPNRKKPEPNDEKRLPLLPRIERRLSVPVSPWAVAAGAAALLALAIVIMHSRKKP
jgi:hypothetical protein